MKSIVMVIFAVCIVGSMAQDCTSKYKAYKQCLDNSHKKGENVEKGKSTAMRAKIDACYTSNGCAPPSKEGNGSRGDRHGNSQENSECGKAIQAALKDKFDACVQKAVPGFVIPSKNATAKSQSGHGQRGFHDTKALEKCANKQAVMDCKLALFHSSQPNDAEKKASFESKCAIKKNCLIALGTDCQAKMEKYEKAACQCRQQDDQQTLQVRATSPACQGGNKGTHPPRPQEQQSCEQKDYCKLGYDAFVKAHPRGTLQGTVPH